MPRPRYVLAQLVLLLGCGGPKMDYSAVTLIDAGGTITLDGQPQPNAVVTFEAPDGQFPYGMTDSSGRYELQFDSDAAGVTPGPKTVRISTTRKILGLNAEEGEGGEASGEAEGAASPAAQPAEMVPARYNTNSELKVEVTPAQTEYNFGLSSQ